MEEFSFELTLHLSFLYIVLHSVLSLNNLEPYKNKIILKMAFNPGLALTSF